MNSRVDFLGRGVRRWSGCSEWQSMDFESGVKVSAIGSDELNVGGEHENCIMMICNKNVGALCFIIYECRIFQDFVCQRIRADLLCGKC